MKKRILLFTVSFLLLIGLVYFSGPQKIVSSLSEAKPIFLVFAILFWTVSCILRGYRWDYLLKAQNIFIPFSRVVKYYITGIFVSNLTPAKSGEPVRALFIKKIDDESFSEGLSSVIAERMIDVMSMFLISIGLLVWMAFSQTVIIWFYVAIIVYTSIFAVGIYLTFSGNKLERVLNNIVSIFSFVPKIKRFESRIEGFAEKFRKSLKVYSSKRHLFISFSISIVIWLVNGALLWSCLFALGVETSFHYALATAVLALLFAVLTMLPGSLGSGEIIRVAVLGGFISASVSTLTSVVLLNRIIAYGMYMVIGSMLFSTFPEEILEW